MYITASMRSMIRYNYACLLNLHTHASTCTCTNSCVSTMCMYMYITQPLVFIPLPQDGLRTGTWKRTWQPFFSPQLEKNQKNDNHPIKIITVQGTSLES